jgi:proteasome lid subunit RPN8/RPN11
MSRLHSLLRRRPRALVQIDVGLWKELLGELAERGRGNRESGAFLLGDIQPGHPRRVRAVVYYDDLDAKCLTGGISFDGTAYGRLWDLCAEKQLRVVADTHTHPGPGVEQSSVDRAHPMIARAQHVALIIPHFAQQSVSSEQVGVHEYLGDGTWNSFLDSDATRRFQIKARRPWTR